MANLDQPQGFRPKGPVLRITEYVAGAEIFAGDLVHLEDDGKVDPAAASEAVCGVALHYASGDGVKVLVSDHPDQRYIVQGDDAGSSDAGAQTGVGLNFPIVAAAGSSTYKCSRQELDASEGAVTAALPLRLLAVEPSSGNAFGANADLIVQINNNQLSNGNVGSDGL